MHAEVSYIRFAGSYSIHQTYDVKRTRIVFKRRERGGRTCIIIVCQFAYFYEFKTSYFLKIVFTKIINGTKIPKAAILEIIMRACKPRMRKALKSKYGGSTSS